MKSWLLLKLGKKLFKLLNKALDPTREKSAHIDNNPQLIACGPALVLEKIENLQFFTSWSMCFQKNKN